MTYSGGGPVEIVGPNGVPWTKPYTTEMNGTAQISRSGTGASETKPNPPKGLSYPGSGTVRCQGSITVTLTWNRDGVPTNNPAGDTPPYAVVVKEASASWSGDGGHCDNGFGDSGIYNPNEASNSSIGVHYEFVPNPGNAIVCTISPSADAVLNNPPQHPMCIAAGARVYVKYSAVPIRIALSGIVSASDHRILVGQNLGASIDTGGLPLGTGATYDWGVSGADPFQAYQISLATYGADPRQFPVSSTLVGFTNQHTPSLSTHLKTEASFNVTCGFYWPWMNQTLSLTDTGNAKRPTVEFPAEIGQPNFVTDQYGFATGMVLSGASSAPSVGILFKGKVTIPSPFTVSAKWNYAQMLTPYRYVDGLQPYDLRTANLSVNGVPGLDTSFPYETPDGIYYDPSYDYDADGNVPLIGDSPGQPFITGSGTHSAVGNDNFVVTLLFKPAGGQYVPLKKCLWGWNARAYSPANTSTGWDWTARGYYVSSNLDASDHPSWNFDHVTAYWTFAP